ncbi:hypothetical protein BZB76_5201 [Actinomadura pelletieri DSM 43383]|uniref:Uncharacterized protein n=1 Tax=Actinomadura pelletieri DSM 43383 TaxID=1120940 RepID=A0A495QFL7_9ACTN|nr:hypothetical protein [Actinomadura pelletieri]RKS70722.1 hypothetical protein BZB76_5201 [Actinomadura pelletieri DSM 43383]
MSVNGGCWAGIDGSIRLTAVGFVGILKIVSGGVWLSQDHQLVPGAQIFRSGHRFFLEAYSASFCRLLLRSIEGDDGLGNHHTTTIDLLFHRTEAIKIETDLNGLTVRCAGPGEAEKIKRGLHGPYRDLGSRVFLLDSRGGTGYVVSGAVGWREGVLGPTRRSFFNEVNTPRDYEPRWPVQPLFGIEHGLKKASVQDLVQAVVQPGQVRREQYRMVHVLMARVDEHEVSAVGVFLTEEDADDAREQLSPTVSACWVEPLPIAL